MFGSNPSWQAAKTKVGKSNGYGSIPGSRAVSSRGVPAKGSKPEPLTSVQDINIQSQALLNVKDSNKDERERIVVRMFKFEELRLEQIQDLENDLMKCFREDLHRRLLSTNFKKQVDGIEMLQKALPAIANEIIEVLDILLKGFVLRFYESNTSCLLKGEKLNSMNLLLYMSPMAVVFLLPTSLIMEPDVLDATITLGLKHRFMWLLLSVNSTMAYAASLTDFLVTKHTSALTLQRFEKWRKERRGSHVKQELLKGVLLGKMVTQSMSGPFFSREMYVPQEPQMERHPLARSSCGVVGPTDWNEALDIIRYDPLNKGDLSSGLTGGSGGPLIMASISFLCLLQLKIFLKILDYVSANTPAFLAKTPSTLPLLRRKETKPHGHGDVHSLLYSVGLLEEWKDASLRWVLMAVTIIMPLFFIRLQFKAIPATLGVSATKGNSCSIGS
ncbi:hypothetical protein Lser_V15G11670 [Lactuca serriola]